MWQDCSNARNGGLPGGCLALNTLWHVRADASYCVTRDQPATQNMIALRTIRGRGSVTLNTSETFEASQETLLIVENDLIRQYRQEAGSWHFWWFEFRVSGPLFFPLRQIMNVPAKSDELELLKHLFSTLRKEAPAQRSLASAGLAYLLHIWIAAVQEQQQASPHQAKVMHTIETMYALTDGSYRVAEMAQQAGLSDRRFRQVFETITGQTPKHFYDGIRLEFARQLLLASPDKIETIAERLGFSSPFHFSRSFRKCFGAPPSHIRNGRN